MLRDILHRITNNARNLIITILEENYPNLIFSLTPENEIYVWVRDSKHIGGREAISLEKPYIYLSMFNEFFFKKLNDKVEPIVKEPDKYFYCTECNRVLPKSELEANVFAGWYCSECAKKSNIAKLIEESKKEGFYD